MEAPPKSNDGRDNLLAVGPFDWWWWAGELLVGGGQPLPQRRLPCAGAEPSLCQPLVRQVVTPHH
jgi:hypothetical protein